jgi:BlaI family transcriptional regulator, penicillinase repressor
MARSRKVARLSAGELEVLEMLWRSAPVTIVGAQRALALPIGYTTVQTRLNRLVAKGIARRSTERPARYEAAVTREQVTAGDLELLIEKVSAGRVVPLVAHLVRDRSLSPEEIAELKELIAEAERAKAGESKT